MTYKNGMPDVCTFNLASRKGKGTDYRAGFTLCKTTDGKWCDFMEQRKLDKELGEYMPEIA